MHQVLQEVIASMKKVDSKKKALLDSLKTSPILYRFMAMNAFQSYQTIDQMAIPKLDICRSFL